jgi:hypothetical protein
LRRDLFMTTPFPRAFPLALAALFAVFSAARGAETDASSQSFPLNYGGIVKVRATTGIIRVNVWDRDEAKVEIIKHCETRDLLEFMRVDLESSFNTLSVTTEIATANGPFGESIDAGSLDLGLTIPRNSKVDIEATSANIRIESVRGEVTVKTTTGPVYVLNLAGPVTLESTHAPLVGVFDIVRDEQIILLKNVYGSIRLQLPSSLAAALKARSAHGPVRCEFPLTLEEEPDGARGVDGALNGGGAHVTCENQNGTILIQRGQ